MGKNKLIKHLWIDLETTGLDPIINGVIQLAGIVEIDGEVKEEFNFRVRPIKGDAVSPASIESHGISIEQMKAYKHPKDIHRAFTKLLSKYISIYDKTDKFHLVGYNAKFDYDFLRRWFEKNGDKYLGSYVWFPPIDIMNLASFYLCQDRASIKNFKLMTVAEFMGLKLTESSLHDASYDIHLTRRLYGRLRRKYGQKTSESRLD